MSPSGGQPDVSVLVVSYNSLQLLPRFAAALEASLDVGFEVLVVDNASRDGSADWVRNCRPHWTLLRNAANVGFGRANNQLLPLVRGRHVLLLNTDAFVAPQTLRLTLQYLETHPEVGVVGVQLAGDDGAVQPSARHFPDPLKLFLQRSGLGRHLPGVRAIDRSDWRIASVVDCDWVPGCYYLIRGELLGRIGLFDPRFFLYYEEVDHCRRVRQLGFRIHCLADTQVIHLGGASSESAGPLTSGGRQLLHLLNESELIYLRKHFGRTGVWTHMVLQALWLLPRCAREWLRRSPGHPSRTPSLERLVLLWSALRLTRQGRVATR